MKNYIYTILIALVFGSCTNVKKLVEQGKYEDAFDYAIKKMAGEENKKTKYVEALEDAYAQMVHRDLSTIDYLKTLNRPELYTKIRNTYIELDRRQNKIRPFLPLVSEDGYAAHFTMNNYHKDIKEATDIAAAHHYNQAVSLLDQAQKDDDKIAARSAWNELKTVGTFFQTYQDKDSLMLMAEQLGIESIYVESVNDTPLSIPRELEYELLQLNLSELDSRWIKYYDYQPEGVIIDHKIIILLKDIIVSPERVSENIHEDQKEIVTGTREVTKYISEQDSTGKEITTPIQVKEDILETVYATTIERILDSDVTVSAQVISIDMKTGNESLNQIINGNYVFHSECAILEGDRRAICDKAIHQHPGSCESFPSENFMLSTAGKVMKKEIINYILNNRT